MGPQVLYLPDGQRFTVTPVFAGLFFQSNDLSSHNSAFPIGWTIVIHTDDDKDGSDDDAPVTGPGHPSPARRPQVHSFKGPTLQSDSIFVSSVSNPSIADFKPPASPTRQTAMMLWVTLYWYFHQQPPPPSIVSTEASKPTPAPGRPQGEWRVRIRRDGMLRGPNLIPKLERMGLIASLDSAVGTALGDSGETWADMFVTRRMFWQLPGRLFLFTLQPVSKTPRSPYSSRPGSPASSDEQHRHQAIAIHPHRAVAEAGDLPGAAPPTSLAGPPAFPISPFFSASHLPTYYPPPPLQYIMTGHVRHPLRPKPPRMGEVFYTRFIPSVGQYLSFRVASIAEQPVPYMGPIGPKPPQQQSLRSQTDAALLESWHANPRVSHFWGQYSQNLLPNALQSRHSFPVIGLWDGVPFGYFEIYWVKEDLLGRYVGSAVEDWDRGCHVLIGEEWARGRVASWLSSLVHWIWCSDYRTANIWLEPRIDNERFIGHLEAEGFTKEKEITFPHKQAWVGRMRRETWEGPTL
ncbi:acyl-CoA N-acyltransferase [Chaetomium sp. MPI-SDFR-AT-0129]|nr:acyl-CoA N-acyltransferase [Chaetomium sp. MPI-SDFR-AT-0129]